MTKNLLSLTSIALLSFLISACASVPMSSPKDDAEAKNFSVPADLSRIYIYRNEILGAAIKVPVALDGKILGQTATKTYFSWDVKPGKHEVTCFASTNSSVNVDLKPGQATYIWQEMKMGLIVAGCALNIVDQETGQKAVQSCKRAQVNPQ